MYSLGSGRFVFRKVSAISVKIQEVSRTNPCERELKVFRVAWGSCSNLLISSINKTAVP